jgi:hypothetical protein
MARTARLVGWLRRIVPRARSASAADRLEDRGDTLLGPAAAGRGAPLAAARARLARWGEATLEAGRRSPPRAREAAAIASAWRSSRTAAAQVEAARAALDAASARPARCEARAAAGPRESGSRDTRSHEALAVEIAALATQLLHVRPADPGRRPH